MATIPLGQYIWARIHQCGINHVFGVPGDFNLTLLDHIEQVSGLHWVGNTNELNAAYAADGYARARDGAGCIITTYGVGELSALNGISGSMAEHVKVVHVVGQTAMSLQNGNKMIHHSIGSTPDHSVFARASREFCCAAAELRSSKGATEEVDRVLREMFIHSKPVYIFVPTDLVDAPVPKDALSRPLDLSSPQDEGQVEKAAAAILDKLYASKNPAIFIDCLTRRYNAAEEMKQLVDVLSLPFYTSPMAKSVIDETHPQYVGIHNGWPSSPGIPAAFDSTDAVLLVGDLPADTNTGLFTRSIPASKALTVDPCCVRLPDGQSFEKVPMKAVLKKMIQTVLKARLPTVPKPDVPPIPVRADQSSKITQVYLWPAMSAFLREGDTVFGETGTTCFGLADISFPPNTSYFAQTYYSCIGFATPAAFGAEVGLSDSARPTRPKGSRTILITGDGSLMLTVQEVGNMIKQSQLQPGIRPVIFILNNEGYTIERIIHGAQMKYNDIVPFNYKHLLPFFNMDESAAKQAFHRAETRDELDAILKLDSVCNPSTVQVVEIILDKLDVPWRLGMQIAARGEWALKEMVDEGFKLPDHVRNIFKTNKN
ncbi:pyruvate decarboxylase isoenzyme [Piedraia hortae CBS 480.64]|uniref:Pyruvate decarboxylase n=1 Tax=Piedraia hortae CBS 480.64 TaxID=1314780 RepID=A0A6A7BT23_9PEZI|nr:pyruvate decarboxylase isoenzyme [Piedraia hortae CBS 480.64]